MYLGVENVRVQVLFVMAVSCISRGYKGYYNRCILKESRADQGTIISTSLDSS